MKEIIISETKLLIEVPKTTQLRGLISSDTKGINLVLFNNELVLFRDKKGSKISKILKNNVKQVLWIDQLPFKQEIIVDVNIELDSKRSYVLIELNKDV